MDLTLTDRDGERIDMVSPFEMGWESAPMDMPGISETARRNRDLMRGILLEVGLTNFPGEWWHWSYGEPGWALRGGHPARFVWRCAGRPDSGVERAVVIL